MWNKIYLALLGVSVLVMAFFSFYSRSWLQSRGNPLDTMAGFEYHYGLAWVALWITTVLLLLVGTVLLWLNQHAWALWSTMLYFAVMVLARYFWLERSFMGFQRQIGFVEDKFSAGPLFGVILIIAFAAIVYLDQLMLVRLHRKMYPPTEVEAPAAPTPED
jgi:hypothetical protein